MHQLIKSLGIPVMFLLNFIYLYVIFKMYFPSLDDNVFFVRKLIFIIGYIIVIALHLLLWRLGQYQMFTILLKSYCVFSGAIFILALITAPMGIVFALIGGMKLFLQVLLLGYVPLLLLVIINIRVVIAKGLQSIF